MKNNTVIFIVGPTAVGKTSLSIKLAQLLNCEIISADSRQFYQEISIGTAKPSKEEQAGIPHHFIDHLSVTDHLNAGQFEEQALPLIESLLEKDGKVIVVGGSGLFVNALAFGLDDIPPTPEYIRSNLNQMLETQGIEALADELKKVDPLYASAIDLQNPHRVMRGLEVYESTGQKLSELQKGKRKTRKFNSIWIGLDLPREELYKRINQRVDLMMEAGLLDEVSNLKEISHLPPLKTVGYQEFYEFEPDKPLSEIVELIKRNSRRYAKRQLTWFRKNQSIQWFKPQQWEAIQNYLLSE